MSAKGGLRCAGDFLRLSIGLGSVPPLPSLGHGRSSRSRFETLPLAPAVSRSSTYRGYNSARNPLCSAIPRHSRQCYWAPSLSPFTDSAAFPRLFSGCRSPAYSTGLSRKGAPLRTPPHDLSLVNPAPLKRRRLTYPASAQQQQQSASCPVSILLCKPLSPFTFTWPYRTFTHCSGKSDNSKLAVLFSPCNLLCTCGRHTIHSSSAKRCSMWTASIHTLR